ncbi:MAG: WXG100 family type VII secretion target [Thermocrispum sp.]
MTSGMWAADTTALARRVGELRAVAAAVQNVVSTLSMSSCDLGPGDIGAAVTEVVDNWRDGLGEMQDKIDTIAGNVDDAVDTYTTVEAAAQDSFQGLYGVQS